MQSPHIFPHLPTSRPSTPFHAHLTTHWARDLPLPDQVGVEVIHVDTQQVLHRASYSTAHEQMVNGDEIGLYVGETYQLRVPSTDLVDEASTEFAPAVDGSCHVALKVPNAPSPITTP